MKKMLIVTLAAALLMAALGGCAQKPAPPQLTHEERLELYKKAIEGARDQEMNEVIPVVTSKEDALADLVLPLVGISDTNANTYAVAISPMNMQAYGIAAILPAADKQEEVLANVNAFVDQQKQNFEKYLVDQYDIAKAAKVETLSDGTILLVMSEGQDQVFQAIKDAIEAGK